jgi:hypothetical protein
MLPSYADEFNDWTLDWRNEVEYKQEEDWSKNIYIFRAGGLHLNCFGSCQALVATADVVVAAKKRDAAETFSWKRMRLLFE